MRPSDIEPGFEFVNGLRPDLGVVFGPHPPPPGLAAIPRLGAVAVRETACDRGGPASAENYPTILGLNPERSVSVWPLSDEAEGGLLRPKSC
jgi:hypothetical protein